MALSDFLGICICRDQSGKAGPIVRDQMFYGLAWVLCSTNFDDFGMQILWTNSYEVHIKCFQFYYLLRTKSSIFRTILYGEFFFCVLWFYGPVNPMGSCRARSVYLTTRLLGRLGPLSG